MQKKTILLSVFVIVAFYGLVLILQKTATYSKTLSGATIVKTNAKTTINWVGHWLHEGDRKQLLTGIATEYAFANQDININLKYPEELYQGSDSLEIRFIIDQIKKPIPDFDIIRIKENYKAIATILNDAYWGEKYLVDFTHIPGFVERHQSFINLNDLSSKTGNILVGPYNEGQFWALYVNTDVAQKMGIKVKQYEMTFDDFLGYIKAVYEYNKSHNTSITAIFEDHFWISTETIFKHLFYSIIGNYENITQSSQLTTQKLDALLQCYKACEDLSKYQPISKARTSVVWSKDNCNILNDSCLFIVNGSWMYNIWSQNDKQKMKKILPCELPVFKPIDNYIGGYTSNWAVLKKSPHCEEAIKLLMYWTTPEIAERWARVTKCPSGVKGNMTTSSFGVEPFEDFMFTIEKKYGGRKFKEVDVKYILGEKNYRVPLHVIDVLEGKITAQSAFRDLKSKVIN